MKVEELRNKLNGELHASNSALEYEISGVFIGDLLSFVMGHGESKQAWITIQGHLNIVAVAALKEFSCIIVAQGASVEDGVIDKAKEEGIAIITTDLSSFEAAKIFYEAGY